jgi:short-subunit dehydrogenase
MNRGVPHDIARGDTCLPQQEEKSPGKPRHHHHKRVWSPAIIALDVSALVDISHAFIGALRSGGTGFLMNVASNAAYQPTPNMAVYGAAKAFVLSFTEALWYESRDTGLWVLALSPGATSTEFFDVVGARTRPMAAHPGRRPHKSSIQRSACSTARIRRRAWSRGAAIRSWRLAAAS